MAWRMLSLRYSEEGYFLFLISFMVEKYSVWFKNYFDKNRG